LPCCSAQTAAAAIRIRIRCVGDQRAESTSSVFHFSLFCFFSLLTASLHTAFYQLFFLTALSLLSHCFLSVFSLLSSPSFFLAAFSLLSRCFFVTFSLLSHCFLTAFSLLSNRFLTAFSLLSDCFLTAFSLLFRYFLTAF
jgi:hypothetical protein